MKIALINTMTPYIRGGAEILVDELEEQLELRNHEVDILKIPFPRDLDTNLIKCLIASRMVRLDDYDMVIAFKFPAYCVNHPNKVMWMFHQFRQIYELWETEFGFKSLPRTETLKNIIKNADDKYISQSKNVFTNALEVTNRLYKYNGIESRVINPPLKQYDKFYKGERGDYIFCPSRINDMKRQHLLVEAMRYTKSDVRLVLAGVGSDEYMNKLNNIINKYNLHDKVSISNGWITDEEKVEKMSNSLAGTYIPYKEDSVGFVTMEALYSHKPAIVCTDSGGTDEFITDGFNGFIVEPNPKALAVAMDKLYNDEKMSIEMGDNAYKDIIQRNITWNETVRRLLG